MAIQDFLAYMEHPAKMELLAHTAFLVSRATTVFPELSVQQAHLAQEERLELVEHREIPEHQERQVLPAPQVTIIFRY